MLNTPSKFRVAHTKSCQSSCIPQKLGSQQQKSSEVLVAGRILRRIFHRLQEYERFRSRIDKKPRCLEFLTKTDLDRKPIVTLLMVMMNEIFIHALYHQNYLLFSASQKLLSRNSLSRDWRGSQAATVALNRDNTVDVF